MHKTFVFLKRRADRSRSDFDRWWREENSVPVARLPGLRRYTVSLDGEEDGVFDGLGELWFDDDAAARGAFASAAGRAVLQDVERHVARSEHVEVEEHRLVDVGLPAPCTHLRVALHGAHLGRGSARYRMYVTEHPIVR